MSIEYLRGESHVYRYIAGEHLLVALRGDNDEPIFALTPSAAQLWTRLEHWATREQLVDDVVTRFEVTRDQADADVAEFLQQLDQVHALVTRGEGGRE